MIGLLILVVLALAVGGALAGLMLLDPGYLLISYADATLETSLWFAAGALLALWLVLAGLIFLVRRLMRSGFRVSAWVASWRRQASRQRSLQGAMLLAEGRWREAGKALLAPAATQTSLLDYFGAARAANELGDYEQRDETLDRARAAIPQAGFVVDLRRAELQQAAAQWQRSVATLTVLQKQAPRHPLVLARLFEAYKALGDWDAVAELAPALPEALDAEVQIAVWRTRLTKLKDGTSPAAYASDVWRNMPKALRSEEALLLAYVDVLASHGAEAAAEAALRDGLKRRWVHAWVLRYGEIRADAPRQLAAANGWLKRHPNDPALLLTLGRLAAAAGESSQAKAHFEASQQAEPSAAALTALGCLCVANGEATAANDYFRRALAEGSSADRE